jgi:ABC-type nitrate/sulfonate/bicarbonate transport system substrate-binding protein
VLAALFLLQTALTLGMPGAAASPEYLALQVARAEGHFAAEGLQVTLRRSPAGE